MFGKGAVFLVMGFSLILSAYQLKLNRLTVAASDNFNEHYVDMVVDENSMNAMNLALSRLWDTEVFPDSFTVVANQCTSVVNVYQIGLDTVRVDVSTRTRIYDDQNYADHSNLLAVRDSMYAVLTYNTPLCEYFMYTNQDNGIVWTTGDTVWGPVHCNHVLRTTGRPVFYGKVTARIGISPGPGTRGNNAHYYGGWEVGIDAPLPTDLQFLEDAAMSSNGEGLSNTVCYYTSDLELTFMNDGRVVRRIGTGTPDTVAVTDIAPDGVLYCTEEVRLAGTLNGRLTILADGDIYVDDVLNYAVDPLVDTHSDDMLGLVTRRDIMISDNDQNNSDATIYACMMALGSITAENYATRPVAGVLKIVGSMAQGDRGAVGTVGWGNSIIHGFSKRYYFDPRLSFMSPPAFPYVHALRLISWWE